MGKNQQRVRQRTARMKVSNPDRASKQAISNVKNPIVVMLQKFPLLLLIALWAGLLAIGYVAMSSLLDTGHNKQVNTSTKDNVAIEVVDEGRLPVLLFGAIAVVCGVGSWSILQQLHPPKPRRPIRRPVKHRPSSPSMAQRQQSTSSASKIPAWGSREAPRSRPIPPMPPKH
jgi:hypothetical protein